MRPFSQLIDVVVATALGLGFPLGNKVGVALVEIAKHAFFVRGLKRRLAPGAGNGERGLWLIRGVWVMLYFFLFFETAIPCAVRVSSNMTEPVQIVEPC